MFVAVLPLRHAFLLLPAPTHLPALLVLLVVLVVAGVRWWSETRDDPARRGEPYGQVIADRWHEPGAPPRDELPELGGGTPGPNA